MAPASYNCLNLFKQEYFCVEKIIYAIEAYFVLFFQMATLNIFMFANGLVERRLHNRNRTLPGGSNIKRHFIVARELN